MGLQMSIALGKQILGVLIALGGISALSRDQHDVVTAGIMFAAALPYFSGAARQPKRNKGAALTT